MVSAIIQPPSIHHLFSDPSALPSDVSTLILPRVMLWHPLVQFPLFSQTLAVCPHEQCTGLLSFYMWPIGQSNGKQPRVIHDPESVVILVGAIYKCSKNHTVYSTDPHYINKIDRVLPFVLLHRTGFTRTFIHSVISLAQEGLSMQAIVRHIHGIRKEFASEMLTNLISDYNVYTEQGLTEEQTLSLAMSTSITFVIQPIPTNDAIARCFIISFFDNKLFYTQQMMRLKVRKCISLDHTFKVASNIGYLLHDGKWVTQYRSILVVLNEEGQAVTWQLTNSTSIDEVFKLLCDLKDRIHLPENSQLTIDVDNCCQVIKKLQQVFDHSETGSISCRATSSTLMLTNMNNFVCKWKNVEHNGQNILTEKVMRQISALCVHIERGCLSNIEPGGGTNHNEALHRYINPHFNHAGRMGLPLAYALLTILLYRHNCKKESSSTLAQSLQQSSELTIQKAHLHHLEL